MTKEKNENFDRQADRQKELSNCSFVKTTLMLLVVIYHCILYWNGSWFIGEPVFESRVLAVLSQWLNSFHIYAFTLVSGYLFAYVKLECGKYSEWKCFCLNKAKRLLVPYVFVSLIWAIPFAIGFFHYDVVDIIKKFAFGTSPNQLWFLLMLFGVFMIFYPLSGFFEKHNLYGVVTVVLIYGFGSVGQAVLPNIFQIFRACTYIPFFWIGFKIRQHGCLWLKKIPTLAWLLVDGLLFALTQYLVGTGGIFFTLLRHGSNFILHIVGAAMAFAVLQKCANFIKWKDSGIFVFFSKCSMPIYLFHQQVVYVLIYCLNGVLDPYIHVGVNIVGTMLVSVLISSVMMRFKWTRILIGEK